MNNQQENQPDQSTPANHVVHRVPRASERLVEASRILIIAACGYGILLLATTTRGSPEDKNWADKQTRGAAINSDLEVARVKKQMREIQMLPIAREQKIQRQRAFLDREIVRAKRKNARDSGQRIERFVRGQPRPKEGGDG
jgi:hypothetical protein